MDAQIINQSLKARSIPTKQIINHKSQITNHKSQITIHWENHCLWFGFNPSLDALGNHRAHRELDAGHDPAPQGEQRLVAVCYFHPA